MFTFLCRYSLKSVFGTKLNVEQPLAARLLFCKTARAPALRLLKQINDAPLFIGSARAGSYAMNAEPALAKRLAVLLDSSDLDAVGPQQLAEGHT